MSSAVSSLVGTEITSTAGSVDRETHQIDGCAHGKSNVTAFQERSERRSAAHRVYAGHSALS